jgi:hypothetical protein
MTRAELVQKLAQSNVFLTPAQAEESVEILLHEITSAVANWGMLIYISINIQLTNPNSLNTQSTPIISIPNDNNILLPFNDVTNH